MKLKATLTKVEAQDFAARKLAQDQGLPHCDVEIEIEDNQSEQKVAHLSNEKVALNNKIYLIKMIRQAAKDIRNGYLELKTNEVNHETNVSLLDAKVWVEAYIKHNLHF